MKVWIWLVAAMGAIAGIVAVTNVPAVAHHARGPFYDNTKSAEANGVVTRFLFRNPHSFLFLDAPGENGDTVAWEIEMGTALSMSRRGWTPDTIKVGDTVKVVGQPSRAPGTFGMCCAEISQADGSPISPAN